MDAIRNRRTRSRTAGLGTLTLLLVLTACTPPAPQPSAGSQPPSQSPTASAGPTASPSPSATGDADETAPPQPGDKVISSTVTHDWSVPGPTTPFHTDHENPVPIAPPPAAPLPTLYAIGAGQHPSDAPPYDQLSFRFTGGFPSYDVEMVPELVDDGSGLPIPMPGTGTLLEVTFRGAQSHTADGTASTVTSAPRAGNRVPGAHQLRAGRGLRGRAELRDRRRPSDGHDSGDEGARHEVEKIEQGQHLYVVAIQLDATAWK